MEFIKHKKVKTRKEHKCSGCNRNFEKGSILESITSVRDRNIQTDYWCAVCESYWNKYMSRQDEVGIGELKSEDEEGWEKERILIEGAAE